MSSNISITRRCEFCGNLFIARTTVTRFCSHVCNSRNYKKVAREEKIQTSNTLTLEHGVGLNAQPLAKEFLTVKDVASLLDCTNEAVYAMISSGRLKAKNLGIRKIRILRSHLYAIFEQPTTPLAGPLNIRKTKKTENKLLCRENCYSISELKEMFNLTRDALYARFKRNKVQKIKIGKEVFYDRQAADRLYKKYLLPKDPSVLAKDKEYNTKLARKPLNKKDCYTIEQCEAKFNNKRSNLYGIFDRRKVPKLKIGVNNYYSKKAIDRLYKSIKEGGDSE